MRTMLIVDDEKNIRMGLKAIIEREYPASYDMLFAAGGEEALEALHARKVDIVITDIRMPGMDGISLIRHAVELARKPAIIILSGYDDFQYAKEAIKYEVKEYLLKPIVRDELYSALGRVEQELEREEEIAGRLGESERYRSVLLATQLNYIFMHSEIGAAEIEERCRGLGLEVFEPEFYVGVLKFAGEKRQNVKAEEYLSRPDFAAKELHFEDVDGHLVIIADRLSVFDGLMGYLADKSISLYYIGLSAKADTIVRIKESYIQAKQASKYSLLQTHSKSALIRYDAIRERGGAARMSVPAEDIRKLANMLGTDREKEMKALLVGLLDVTKAEADICYVEEIGRLLNETVFDGVFRQYGEESVEILKLYKQVGNIHHFAALNDYFHQVENLLLRLNDYIRDIKSAHGEHREMKKAVQYIHDNYSRDLNMAIVSNHVSLNYSYFSQIFKEYTGQSFVHYLKKVRIDKAKELLRQTDDKVYEIGAKVGFENSKQFNRVFREMEGVSALEYRSRAR